MRERAWYEPLLESGALPDRLVRFGIRRVLRERLRQEARLDRTDAFARALSTAPIALGVQQANAQHYEVPSDFFVQVLGPHLKYSAGLWTSPAATLEDAEREMLELTCERAALADRQRILELGCGWGSLTLFMAARFPRAVIVAVSNSRSQRDYIEAQAHQRGLRNVTVVTADMNHFSPQQAGVASLSPAGFDRAVSVEMFEHMRNYPLLLQRIHGWMADDGQLFVHIFAHARFAYPYEPANSSDWMAEHFFTGGTMPSEDLLPRFNTHWRVERQWRVEGTHYARTCNAWLANLDHARADVDRILARTYGKEATTRWRARWRTFFMACAELFAYNGGHEWFVAHYRFRKATHSETMA